MLVDASKFTWNPQTRVLCAERSDLGLDSIYEPVNQGCGMGLRMMGKLGVATFFIEREEKREGEVLYTVLKPTRDSVRANPKLDGISIHIFND